MSHVPADGDAPRARSALAAARVVTLVTYPCGGPRRRHRCTAELLAGGDEPVVRMPDDAVREHLRRRPVATVLVSARGFGGVTVHARTRHRGGDEVALEVLAVRVGRRGVPLGDFHAATADPLAATSQDLLAHLDGRAEELRRCIAAQGVQAAWVTPSRIDRHGLVVQAVTPDGVGTHRLAFPRPVTCLADVDPAYRPFLRQPPP